MPESLRVEALEINRNYRVIYHNPADHLPREMVASYIGQEDSNDYLYFSGRPTFGTTPIKIVWIKEIWTTDKPKMIPTIYRGETRIF